MLAIAGAPVIMVSQGPPSIGPIREYGILCPRGDLEHMRRTTRA